MVQRNNLAFCAMEKQNISDRIGPNHRMLIKDVYQLKNQQRYYNRHIQVTNQPRVTPQRKEASKHVPLNREKRSFGLNTLKSILHTINLEEEGG